jgi:DNA-3-methyladenine glycosylase I
MARRPLEPILKDGSLTQVSLHKRTEIAEMFAPAGGGLGRCWGTGDELMTAYHDGEWGFPLHDDQALFAHLMLDIFQAGLSWRTILYKRQAFLLAFDGFQPEVVARYGTSDRRRLLANKGVVRNRMKIDAVIVNARACLNVVEQFGSFDRYLWRFTQGGTLKGPPARTFEELPTSCSESDAMAQDLRARGFRFVGTTICYAFMQAVGMIDDHLIGCYRYRPEEGIAI